MVVLIFETASDIHWMKDVVQFPNAISRVKMQELKATIITRPNHKQLELQNHINLFYLGESIPTNYYNFENSIYNSIETSSQWYYQACKYATKIASVLILYPFYGDASSGARYYKLKRWLSFKKSIVILKSDGTLGDKSKHKPSIKEIIKDRINYFFIDKIVIENFEIFSNLKTNYPHLSKKLYFVPNCPLNLYHSQNMIPYNMRSNNFLFVGRVSDLDKGINILLDAWSKISGKIPSWTLSIVGPYDVEFKEEWDRKFENLKIKDSVIWYGMLNPEDLIKVYGEAKIVVCSSRKESGPIVLSEAALSGCAFIGTNVGEISDVLKGLPGLVTDINEIGDVMLSFTRNDNIASEQAKTLHLQMRDRRWDNQIRNLFL